MDRLVLSDAAPLICLAQVGGLPWLSALFGRVHITEAVREEILTGLGKPGEDALAQAIMRHLLRVDPQWDWRKPQFPGLGKGEASCIRSAANLLKRQCDCLLLIDDREARRVAASLMIPVTGTAAVVGAAKQAGLIASARAVFDQLLQSGFRIWPGLVDAILEGVGRLVAKRNAAPQNELRRDADASGARRIRVRLVRTWMRITAGPAMAATSARSRSPGASRHRLLQLLPFPVSCNIRSSETEVRFMATIARTVVERCETHTLLLAR